jgi:hypothetical protein
MLLDIGLEFKMGIQYNASIKTTGLVFCMDAASKAYGETAQDMTGSHTTTLVNDATFNSADFGSIEFDGTDDYITTSLNGAELSGTEFTIDLWINPDVNNGAYGLFSVNTGDGLEFRMNSVKYRFLTGGSNYEDTGATAAFTGTWSNLIAVKKTNSIEIYYNGELSNTKSVSNTNPSYGTGDVIIAGRASAGSPSGTYWNGKISVVRVYDKALSSVEIRTNYDATKRRYL